MARKKKKTPRLKKKLDKLIALLKQMESVLIAYSGGTDSSLLLKIANHVLGNNVIAVTASSPIFPPDELQFTRRITAEWGINHRIVKINLFKNPLFVKNTVDRCYYCKRELFKTLWGIAYKYKINFVLDGSNISDSRDFRPGSKARSELGVRSPLDECAIGKQDIYRLSELFDLSTKNKPATVCLASRIPYGQPIVVKDLITIYRAESYFRGLGFTQVRLRHYSLGLPFKRRRGRTLKLARIELDKNDIYRLVNSYRPLIISYLNQLGYDYITLDLEGYRKGSLNLR